jgi:hypothetical protein
MHTRVPLHSIGFLPLLTGGLFPLTFQPQTSYRSLSIKKAYSRRFWTYSPGQSWVEKSCLESVNTYPRGFNVAKPLGSVLSFARLVSRLRTVFEKKLKYVLHCLEMRSLKMFLKIRYGCCSWYCNVKCQHRSCVVKGKVHLPIT